MKTQEEKNQALERIKQNLERSNERSMFGDNCHNALRAMIEAIEGNFSYEDCDKFHNDYTRDGATSAVDWMNGDVEDLEDLLYPEL